MKQTQPAENHLNGNTRQNQMDADAEAYEELSKPQYESGCKFISELNLSSGDKVLDMGCGH